MSHALSLIVFLVHCIDKTKSLANGMENALLFSYYLRSNDKGTFFSCRKKANTKLCNIQYLPRVGIYLCIFTVWQWRITFRREKKYLQYSRTTWYVQYHASSTSSRPSTVATSTPSTHQKNASDFMLFDKMRSYSNVWLPIEW